MLTHNRPIRREAAADIRAYIRELNQQFGTGIATEHTHRPALQALLESVVSNAQVTNEPKHIACGAPDFVLTRSNIPLGYVEAKDLDKNLDDTAHQEQLGRYARALNNLLFTNYLEFRLLRDGKPVARVRIAEVSGTRIKSVPKNFADFTELLGVFAGYEGQTLTTAAALAECMAAKTRMLAEVITQALHQDEGDADDQLSDATRTLKAQLRALREHLIDDIKVADFAGLYAQTVAYGMFAARLHDTVPGEDFTRTKAAQLIPATNPFLRKFFQHIVGYDLDERLRWIVDDLADVLRAADVGELMKEYGKTTQRNDPFLHFYETFLGAYNPKLRKGRGVYYTPEPVVYCIVRAVDEILQTEFGLLDGLADSTTTTVKLDKQPDEQSGTASKVKKAVHRVQILDPATGTGTFLAAIVKYIHEQRFAGQQGSWSDYVKNELVPRLNGFEVLMAPYAMAHTKLEMVLRETGCELDAQRLRIFLTNALEERRTDTGALFVDWLAQEAEEANLIKRKTPVMVVLGNPPYSGHSANKGAWMDKQLKDYKKEPGGGPLRERNYKWLNDDYVKFIRYGQYYIDRTGEGVLAYINNHSFLDNPTFRGMRWSLLRSFDKIYIIDLHGNSKKQEVSPDGSPDKNVFDIQQGVSINLFVKTGKKAQDALARVFHYDLYGHREGKYQFLWEHSLEQVDFQELELRPPQYFFVPRDYGLQAQYEKGLSVSVLFPVSSVGIVTARDKFTIHHTPKELKSAIGGFLALDDETARTQYSLGPDVKDWEISLAREDLQDNVFGNNNDTPVPICYRPFDTRHTYYTGNSKGFHCRARRKVMRHFLEGDNVGLIFKRGGIEEKSAPIFLTKYISESRSWSRPGMQGIETSAPLYVYPDTVADRESNLDPEIMKNIAVALGLRFTSEKQGDDKTFAPIDLLDYIYAVLHSPSYRARYKAFLKTDFPRVPYPSDKALFWKWVELGGRLRALHLLEGPTLDALITTYPASGDNLVTNRMGKDDYEITDTRKRLGKVRINKQQYFGDVPEVAWNFYIGGYQPAQKWLKDRQGRTLTHQDIVHYQKIIVALTETDRLMRDIDTLPFLD